MIRRASSFFIPMAAIAVAAFWFHPAHAAMEQSNDSSVVNVGAINVYAGFGVQGDGGTYSYFTIRSYSTSTPDSGSYFGSGTELKITHRDDTDGLCQGAIGSTVIPLGNYFSTSTYDPETGFYDVSFQIPTTTFTPVSGECFDITFFNLNYFSVSETSTIVVGQPWGYTEGDLWTYAFSNMSNLDWWSVNPYYYFSNSLSPPSAATVAVSFPQNGTSTPDFPDWGVSVSGVSDSGVVGVFYSQDSSTLGYSGAGSYGDQSDWELGVSPPTVQIQKTVSLFSIASPSPQQWYAQAYFVSSSTTVLSPVVSFYVVQPGGLSGSLPGSSSTCVTVPNYWTDPAGNNLAVIENAICNGITFLAIPNVDQQAAINYNFQLLGESVKNKPPFGYFTQASAALSSIQDDGSSSAIMDASSTAAFSNIFSPIDTGLAGFVYLGMIFTVVTETKKFI